MVHAPRDIQEVIFKIGERKTIIQAHKYTYACVTIRIFVKIDESPTGNTPRVKFFVALE